MNYQDAIEKISWGYIFIYISLNLGTVNIFPAWAGFLLIYLSLDAVAEMQPSAKLLKPFALLLMAEDLAEWVLNIFSMTPDLYWIDVFANVIILYFHFQLLTNLANIAEGQGSQYTGRLKKLRSVQTVFMTVIALIPVSKRAAITLAESGVVAFGIGLFSVIVMLVICVTLFQYKRELRGIEEKSSLVEE
ncbi:Uncharacterised protein [uncultured Eubacterium sp.]|nr:Uncharacterised protein [uncultured Eubacterium sp.]